MGVLTKITKINEELIVEIPTEILPEEYRIGRAFINRPLYVYGNRGPTLREGYFEAIEAARIGRYRVGFTIPESMIKEYGFPRELRLVRIFYPAVPGIRREGVWVSVPERPRIALKRYTRTLWHAQIPRHITRSYSLYAFPTRRPRHPLAIYNPIIQLEWISDKIIPEVPDVYHLGRYYKPEWKEKKWIWKIPPNSPCFEPVMVGLSLIGAAPAAQCFFEDGTVYIDIIFSPSAGKAVARRLGYAYRNMVVRNYSLTEEMKEEVDYPLALEFRATYLSACPIEFYQSSRDKHIKLIDALGITVSNMMQLTYVRAAEKKETVQLTLDSFNLREAYPHLEGPLARVTRKEEGYFGLTEDDELVETMGSEEQVKIDFGEAEPFPFYRCYKYIRIISEHTYKRRGGKPYVYLNDKIESWLKEMPDKIIDKNGFVWRVS